MVHDDVFLMASIKKMVGLESYFIEARSPKNVHIVDLSTWVPQNDATKRSQHPLLKVPKRSMVYVFLMASVKKMVGDGAESNFIEVQIEIRGPKEVHIVDLLVWVPQHDPTKRSTTPTSKGPKNVIKCGKKRSIVFLWQVFGEKRCCPRKWIHYWDKQYKKVHNILWTFWG